MAVKIVRSFEELYQKLDIQQYKSISFHHHLRNGDFVINKVLGYYLEQSVSHLHVYPSSIFPSYTGILRLLENQQIDSITTNYMNGPVAEFISKNGLVGELHMQTHGGRARNIIDGTSQIDIAYIAAPTVDKMGNAIGYAGPSKCGSLGYAVPDSKYAKICVLITDNLIDNLLEHPEIEGQYVDYIVLMNKIGDPTGIVSGTTSITTNPTNVKIARDTIQLLDEIGMIKEGFSFQSGAGGTSLRVTKNLHDLMVKKQIKASFFSGGITGYHVKMLEEGLVNYLYDVQCFDLEAVASLAKNKNHIAISSDDYANPINDNRVIKNLDMVILGATEIDLDFNVNVTTDSHGMIIGGSGGHSDTAQDSKLSIIVAPLFRSRLPLICERVTTITTLGKYIDVLVTERGIAINPRRTDIIQLLSTSTLPIYTIRELMDIAYKYTGIPKKASKTQDVIGVVEDRTQTIIDQIYRIK
jgi:citrate lyase subunit alpha/citrate CoA-transferase